MKKTTWPGNWKVACHVCGFWYPSGEIKKRWDGLLVCDKDYETRHPQTLIKVRGEHAFPEFVSRDAQPDTEQFFCDIFKGSPYASMGTAGCMQVGPYRFTYDFLLDMNRNGHEPFGGGATNPPIDLFARADMARADLNTAGS